MLHDYYNPAGTIINYLLISFTFGPCRACTECYCYLIMLLDPVTLTYLIMLHATADRIVFARAVPESTSYSACIFERANCTMR